VTPRIALIADRARQLHRELEQAQRDFSRFEAQGFGGNGVVKATVCGDVVLVALALSTDLKSG
jgi:DNA-binding protein YbaB